jgi:hypothetical protein
MKLQITLKDPDALRYCLQDAVEQHIPDANRWDKEALYEDLYAQVNKWFTYGEYVTLEYDTEKDAVTVLSNS